MGPQQIDGGALTADADRQLPTQAGVAVFRMQGIALVGVFLRLTPFATRAGLEGEVLMREVRKRLQRFFGKRGERVVDANLALIREAYEGVIDVTGGLAQGATTGQREVLA